MSKSDCDDQEWSVIDDAQSTPRQSPSCIDSDFEDLASPQPERDQSSRFENENSIVVQQPVVFEEKQGNDSVESAPVAVVQSESPISVPSVFNNTESVVVIPQSDSAEEREVPQIMSGSATPASPQSSVLDQNPCSPSFNAVLEFPASAPQSESELEEDEKHFDLNEQPEVEETEQDEESFLTQQCPVCSRHSTSEKQCSFCCFELQWDCPRCTYLNSFADDACLMCGLGAEPDQSSRTTQSTLAPPTRTVREPTHVEHEDAEESADFDDVSFFKDSDRRRCATDTAVKRQKDRVAVKVSIPLQFNLLNQPTRVLNEEAARKREAQTVQEFNLEDIVRIRSMLGFKSSNSHKRDQAAGSGNSDNNLEIDEEYSEHVRSMVSRRNAKARATKSKRNQAKLNSHDKRKARSDAKRSLSRAFDFEDLSVFRQQCADRHATELLNGTVHARTYWRGFDDVLQLKAIRTIPLPESIIDRFFDKCKTLGGKKSKYAINLAMQAVSNVHPSLMERLSTGNDDSIHLVVFAVFSHPNCLDHVPSDHELPLFEVDYEYRYTIQRAPDTVTRHQSANRTTLALLHKMADRLRSKAFFDADLVRHSQEVAVTAE